MTPIDLGLPSGTKWAPMNVGASAPEEAGKYFSWGNTDGHTPGDGYEFTETRYNNTPGAEVSGQLPLANDAARVNMGGNWRIPTKTEVEELINNCTYLWTTQNGIAGALFTSNINGSTIFFPAAGRFDGANLEGLGENASYIASTLTNASNCDRMYFDDEGADADGFDRYFGQSVRAVQ